MVCAAGKSEIQVIGEKEGVEKAVAEVKKQLDEASAQATVRLEDTIRNALKHPAHHFKRPKVTRFLRYLPADAAVPAQGNGLASARQTDRRTDRQC